MSQTRSFSATIEVRARGGGIAIRLPFDPSAEWGARERHDVHGTIAGHRVRGRLIARDGAHFLEAGPAWCRDEGLAAGTQVSVALAPEGPQVESLGPDFSTALEAEPDALHFWGTLPTFYRKNFVRWVEGAKRPETRARRIADTVSTLKAGKRER